MSCPACGEDAKSVAVTSLEWVKEIYGDPHEGVAVARCGECGRLFVRFWVEVYEDIHRYYVPVSEPEAADIQAGGLDENAVREKAVKLLSARRHLKQLPGSKTASWWQAGPPVIGPSW